jgi:integrase
MTAHSLDRLWLLSTDVAAQCETSAQADTKSRVLVDGTVVLRRCALYRDAFRYIAVSLPAELLRFEAVAEWARRQRVTVDVTTADELDHAISVGISPPRGHAPGQRHRRADPPRRERGGGTVRRQVTAADRDHRQLRRTDSARRRRCDDRLSACAGIGGPGAPSTRPHRAALHIGCHQIAVIAAWLGHASAAFTMSVYAHSQDDALKSAASSFGRVVTTRDIETGSEAD